jgi:hypothetical protein
MVVNDEYVRSGMNMVADNSVEIRKRYLLNTTPER